MERTAEIVHQASMVQLSLKLVQFVTTPNTIRALCPIDVAGSAASALYACLACRHVQRCVPCTRAYCARCITRTYCGSAPRGLSSPPLMAGRSFIRGVPHVQHYTGG